MSIRIITFLIVAASTAINVAAANYYVSQGVIENVVYNHGTDSFKGGENAFSTIGEAVMRANGPSVIYVQPGIYNEDVTIATDGITLLGANAYGEERSSTRTQAESTVTGKITVNASDVTINGFRFTENARIINTTATTGAPISNFTFTYNSVEALTLDHTDSQTMLRLGTIYSGSNASLDENNRRYANITITNNVFKGDAGHMSHFVLVCNACGNTTIENNTFTNGGRPICVTNTQDTLNISHNRFTAIGADALTFASTIGEFCVQLRYMGAKKVVMSVTNNEFDNCQGQSNGYYPVVLDQGSDATHLIAADGSSLKFNYNIIKNFLYNPAQISEYNYFLWANAANCAPITLDTRFNRCDNSEIAFGAATPEWANSSQHYFAGSTGMFDFDDPGVTADYYVNPTGAQQHQYKLKTNSAAQSFDIDTESGDIYYIQTEGSGDEVLPLRVTRYLFRDDKTTGRQYMYLTNASHGANMSVFRHEGKVWIATGGASIYEGHCKPQSSVLLPFVSGATADCGYGKTSFTYNGKTYPIIQFKNQWGSIGCYPAIDVDNRLFCENHTASSGKVRFAIYDLDDVLANGSNARLIKAIIIQKGSKKYENSDNAYADIVDTDEGFSTTGWAMQGYDISGDMIYRHSGVGLHNAYAYSYGGKSIPTIMQDCINWRDSVYVHRKPVLNSKIISAPNGEPEGVKIIRDKLGRPHMIMQIVWGTPGQRTSTLVDFAPSTIDHQGFTYTIPKTELYPELSQRTFTLSALGSQIRNIKVDMRKFNGQTTAVISGPDADCFNVGKPVRSGLYIQSDKFSITFTPNGKKASYNATLRISMPGADDKFVTLKGNYTGKLSGIDNVESETGSDIRIIGYYDLNGRQLNAPANGVTIVKYSDGSAGKIVR